MDMTDITALLAGIGVGHYDGYAPTGASLPYVVNRPLLIDTVETAINGGAVGWDYQFSLYCCAGSVNASFNLAVAAISALQGQRSGDSTLAASMGYSGAQVEGHYESQVTVQINQGGI